MRCWHARAAPPPIPARGFTDAGDAGRRETTKGKRSRSPGVPGRGPEGSNLSRHGVLYGVGDSAYGGPPPRSVAPYWEAAAPGGRLIMAHGPVPAS